jgi:hypothetical protein
VQIRRPHPVDLELVARQEPRVTEVEAERGRVAVGDVAVPVAQQEYAVVLDRLDVADVERPGRGFLLRTDRHAAGVYRAV